MLLVAVGGCRSGQPSQGEAQPASPAGGGAKQQGALAVKAPPKPLDPALFQRILRRDVSQAPGEGGVVVLRVTNPRTDVAVRVDGSPMPPAAGLTSWAAFQPTAEGTMVMGDTVVFQDEVDGVMDAAFAHGLEITALHNHFFFDEPKAYFMHVGGRGPANVVASGVQAMWAAIESTRRQRPAPPAAFGGEKVEEGPMDIAAIGEIADSKVTEIPGGAKVTVARTASMGSDRFGGSLGLTTWASFVGSDLGAFMAGDFAMTAAEVQPVLRALRSRGVHVVALHNHMVGGDPFYYFVHFWATGPAPQLALAFRVARQAQEQAAASAKPM